MILETTKSIGSYHHILKRKSQEILMGTWILQTIPAQAGFQRPVISQRLAKEVQKLTHPGVPAHQKWRGSTWIKLILVPTSTSQRRAQNCTHLVLMRRPLQGQCYLPWTTHPKVKLWGAHFRNLKDTLEQKFTSPSLRTIIVSLLSLASQRN